MSIYVTKSRTIRNTVTSVALKCHPKIFTSVPHSPRGVVFLSKTSVQAGKTNERLRKGKNVKFGYDAQNYFHSYGQFFYCGANKLK